MLGSVLQRLVTAGGVPPMHPVHCFEFYFGLAGPGWSGVNKFCLVQPVHCLRQSVIVCIPGTSHRGSDSGIFEVIGVENADVLGGFNRWLQHCCFGLIVSAQKVALRGCGILRPFGGGYSAPERRLRGRGRPTWIGRCLWGSTAAGAHCCSHSWAAARASAGQRSTPRCRYRG